MIIERLANDVLSDNYFLSLITKVSKNSACHFFLERTELLTCKEFYDLLRFTDILSNSKNPIARNKAYQIITLLNPSHNQDPHYKTVSHSVLAKLGNFPGINYLRKTDNNHSELPFDRMVEKTVKEFIQAVPEADNLVFTDIQFELYTELSSAKCFSFSGPTSMGKSFIIKSFIRKAISNSPPENIVIMVPTRALINQFSIDFNKELKESLAHYKYKIVTNSNVSELPSEDQQHYIFVLTPERLISYLSQKRNPPFGYLFVDEAHKIAAEMDSRSITSYTAISKALRSYPGLNLYFSSPNVSNPEVLLRLFKKDEKNSFKTIESPVSQNLFFINFIEKSVTHYTDESAYQFNPSIITEAQSIYDIIDKLGKSTTNIIYCSSRFQAVDRASQLYRKYSQNEISVPKEVKKVIRQIKAYIHKDYYLADFLSKGIAYHFGNLPQIIRNKVEYLLKDSHIDFVFCTSTLLEGVNLPAKNVFILNNKNGTHKFKPIDFWNLAGRAGRLKYELSGNIICLKESESDWKKPSELLDGKKNIELNPTIESYIDKKLKHIEKILNQNNQFKETETIKEILSYIANIICIDTLEIKRAKYQSPIIEKLIKENKDAILELAKARSKNIEVPSAVLDVNQSIKINIQNKVYQQLKKSSKSPSLIKLPNEIDYESCKIWLRKMYALFEWGSEEKKLIKKEGQLDYFAMLMNQWINGFPLSSIINQSIDFHHDNNRDIKVGFSGGKLAFETFNKANKVHVNILIGDIIDSIEKVLRFLFEKYFNNYYMMLVEILGESNAGVNWATFLEYGSRNSIIIALQNYGLSRHSANYIFKEHRNCLVIESDKLANIRIEILKRQIDTESPEYDEINSILF